MSLRMKALFPAVGMLFLFGFSVVALNRHAREVKQPLPQTVGDLTAAKSIEVTDAGGQVVLSGALTFATARDGDVEGEAKLTPAAHAPGASGKAEVEVSTGVGGAKKQELELEARGLASGAAYGLQVDGRQAATFNADDRGAAELELSSEPRK